jgi:hypothetical protein
MLKGSTSDEINEINLRMEKIANSAIEFRQSISEAIFKRLERFFIKRNIQVTKTTSLETLFPGNNRMREWDQLNEIGLIIPELRRSKVYNYLTAAYFITFIVGSGILVFKNLDLIFVLWGLPVSGIVITFMGGGPIVLFMMIFKKKNFSCATLEELVDQIVSANWANLLYNDKRLFKVIIAEEERIKDNKELHRGSLYCH